MSRGPASLFALHDHDLLVELDLIGDWRLAYHPARLVNPPNTNLL